MKAAGTIGCAGKWRWSGGWSGIGCGSGIAGFGSTCQREEQNYNIILACRAKLNWSDVFRYSNVM